VLAAAAGGDAAMTVGASAMMLLANFGTGVLLAQALGPSGRGASAAIMTAPTVLAWFFALGSVQTISYFQAKDPASGGRLLGTWLALALPLGVLATVVGEALLPILFAAQSDATLRLGQELMLIAVLLVLNEALRGMILGDRRFALFNLMRAGAPAALALSYGGLLAAGELTVASSVLAFALVQTASTLVLLVASAMRHGIGRPSRALARSTLWYGIKGHGTNMSTFLNARLDLLIMPAFLSSSSVGLYSVATNVSWIVVALSGSLWVIVLPLATQRGAGSSEVVWRYLRISTAIGAIVAAVLAAVAPFALKVVYGSGFVDAAPALRILLPGSVLFAAAHVLISGLFASNRPFSATLAQGAGAAVTIVGLLIFLRPGGILAAAIVSSIAYTLVFVAALVLYRSASRAGTPRQAADASPAGTV
jgi:O-antigen/teichoic acid export membrane protein